MDERAILRTLRPASASVDDPVSGQSVWLAGLVKRPRVEDGTLCFDLAFTEAYDRPTRRRISKALKTAIRFQGFGGSIRVTEVIGDGGQAKVGTAAATEAGSAAATPEPPRPVLDGVGLVLGVGSGKGGVGKSTIATNLAVGLAQHDLTVGLLDADVHGPSLPTMMGVEGRPLVDRAKRILPRLAHGVRCLSMGQVVDPEQPMIWRGAMVGGALQQLALQADWRGVDVLVVDLPPGTGDAHLTLVQEVRMDGVVVVTTPGDVACADTDRALAMWGKLQVPVVGLVENMAWYELPDGTRDPVFGEGGTEALAARHRVPLLGQVPLRSAIRQGGDAGTPAVLTDGPTGEPLRALAAAVRRRLEPASG